MFSSKLKTMIAIGVAENVEKKDTIEWIVALLLGGSVHSVVP